MKAVSLTFGSSWRFNLLGKRDPHDLQYKRVHGFQEVQNRRHDIALQRPLEPVRAYLHLVSLRTQLPVGFKHDLLSRHGRNSQCDSNLHSPRSKCHLLRMSLPLETEGPCQMAGTTRSASRLASSTKRQPPLHPKSGAQVRKQEFYATQYSREFLTSAPRSNSVRQSRSSVFLGRRQRARCE